MKAEFTSLESLPIAKVNHVWKFLRKNFKQNIQ